MSQWLRQSFRVGFGDFNLPWAIKFYFRFRLSKWGIIIAPPPNGKKVYIEVYICAIFRKKFYFTEMISCIATCEQFQHQFKMMGC